jgi:hypothetical protein
MECIDIGSKIITIVIMTHGAVIETNLSYEKQNIFDNTRLFSLAGDFSKTGLGLNILRTNHVGRLNSVFQRNLPDSTTSEVVEKFAKDIHPKYEAYIKSFLSDLSTENICKVFQTITIDKILSTDITGAFAEMMQCILPDVVGVYIISVHEKIDPNTIKLIYPLEPHARNFSLLSNILKLKILRSKPPNLNLLERADFIEFANIFGQNGEEILSNMNKLSTESPWPSGVPTPDNISYKDDLNRWNVTFTQSRFWNATGNISDIRLSYLVYIIKTIVCPENPSQCKMNIFDYSCSMFAPTISPQDKMDSKYLKEPDIERGDLTGKWGGRGRRKKRKTRKRGLAQK